MAFPLVEFQLWTREKDEKRTGDVRHTWRALSKNPSYEQVIMNIDNYNSTYHTYTPKTLYSDIDTSRAGQARGGSFNKEKNYKQK